MKVRKFIASALSVAMAALACTSQVWADGAVLSVGSVVTFYVPKRTDTRTGVSSTEVSEHTGDTTTSHQKSGVEMLDEKYGGIMNLPQYQGIDYYIDLTGRGMSNPSSNPETVINIKGYTIPSSALIDFINSASSWGVGSISDIALPEGWYTRLSDIGSLDKLGRDAVSSAWQDLYGQLGVTDGLYDGWYQDGSENISIDYLNGGSIFRNSSFVNGYGAGGMNTPASVWNGLGANFSTGHPGYLNIGDGFTVKPPELPTPSLSGLDIEGGSGENPEDDNASLETMEEFIPPEAYELKPGEQYVRTDIAKPGLVINPGSYAEQLNSIREYISNSGKDSFNTLRVIQYYIESVGTDEIYDTVYGKSYLFQVKEGGNIVAQAVRPTYSCRFMFPRAGFFTVHASQSKIEYGHKSVKIAAVEYWVLQDTGQIIYARRHSSENTETLYYDESVIESTSAVQIGAADVNGNDRWGLKTNYQNYLDIRVTQADIDRQWIVPAGAYIESFDTELID